MSGVGQLTIAECFAAGRDAANRRMRDAGRSKWNAADWNAGVAEFDRLAPHAVDASGPLKAALKKIAAHARRRA